MPDASGKAWKPGDFELLTKGLGEGAYAKVVQGKRSDGVDVAVKVMEKSVVQKSNFVNLELEIEVMETLKHENIVNMNAWWDKGGEIFIALDFCGGGELFKYMKKYEISHMPKVAPFFIGETVLALEYLRSMNVVHRDLKPENILLTSSFHVKLADFGTACFLDRDEAEVKKFTGTAQYMGPEMLKDTSKVRASFEGDLWALGCIVFQLFCGRPPYGGMTEYLIFQNVLNTTLEYPPYVNKVTIDFIAQLLRHSPKDRIGSEATGGFPVLKQHPFFTEAQVDWATIQTRKVESNVDKDHTSEWKKFLLANEDVVYASQVIKTRHLLSKKTRWLVLTTYPRLFYVESKDSHEIKDHVEWTDDINATCTSKSKSDFKVNTSKRVYNFEDVSGHAHLWVNCINKQAALKRQKGGKK
eukprot:TRINITY_DN2979_c1_g1_i1.p1 TRINITY_DN2979_c1_g1~~TRINITY_DN2979_c1_g1_i1.p1  ORF type:complete len:437 (+),score=156.62 TRINITY_DN2979_c1_g1_i1:73-1311(+)